MLSQLSSYFKAEVKVLKKNCSIFIKKLIPV